MSLIDRAKAILLKPETEWRVIAEEPTDIASLLKNYAAILALIPLTAGIAGAALFGMLLQQMRIGILSPIGVLADQLAGYVGGLAAIFAAAFIVSAVAPSFNGRQDLVQACKLLIYAMTAIWVASLLMVIPPLGTLAMLAGAAYAFYLIYLGAGPVLGIPADKVAGFTVVVIMVFLLVGFIFFLLRTAISGIGNPVLM